MRQDDITIVVYMNREWRREWGGETIIYTADNDIELAQLPRYNRAVMFEGHKWHCARSVTRICPALRVTVVFKLAPVGCDDLRDSIQKFIMRLGAFGKRHTSNGSLGCHLLGVYDLLRLAGAGSTICAAGGLHSIFGTTQFTVATIDKSRRPEVASIIGEEATKIVDLFSVLKRPSTLEDTLATLDPSSTTSSLRTALLELDDGGSVSVKAETFVALVLIEAANLSDQQRLLATKYPRLSAFWENYRSTTKNKNTRAAR